VRALWRLARVYEARQLLVSARDCYLDLLTRYPKQAMVHEGRSWSVGELAAAELGRPAYASIAADRPEPPTPLPLFRKWHWQPRESLPVKAIFACGVLPSADSGRVFLAEKTGLRLLDPETGAPRWVSELGAPPVWAGYLSDKLIVATSRQIAALELSQGSIQWRFDVAKAGKHTRRPDPFAEPALAVVGPQPAGPSLSGFQISKGRVFCVRSHSELYAIDGDSGALEWSFTSPPGQIIPNLWIGAEQAVLQIDKPNQLLVLSTGDGRLVNRTALNESEQLQRPPLPIDETSVILVSDRCTVKRFDLKRGQTSWVFQESKKPPTNGPPRMLGGAETLLMLHDGATLIRLDAATGKKRWETFLGENLSERPGSIAVDGRNLYCVTFETFAGKPRPALRAVALKDGSRVWSCPLSGPPDSAWVWSIALSERSIFAFPSATESTGAGGDLASWPVIVHRREDGALIERLVFQAAVSEVAFKVDPRRAIVATDKDIWSLSSKSE
jgi:outer membrane protein assembly factor BamB